MACGRSLLSVPALTRMLLIIQTLIDERDASYTCDNFALETSFGIAHISALRLGEDRCVACTKKLAIGRDQHGTYPVFHATQFISRFAGGRQKGTKYSRSCLRIKC